MNLEIFEVHGGPNYGLLDSPSSTFHINLFFHTSLSFAKEQLAYHILILIGCKSPVTDWEISVKNHPLCCGCTHSVFCADSQWKIDQNMHLIDSTKLSSLRLTNFLCMCASSAHCQFFMNSLSSFGWIFSKEFSLQFSFLFENTISNDQINTKEFTIKPDRNSTKTDTVQCTWSR